MFMINNITITGLVSLKSGSESLPPPPSVGGSMLFNGTSDNLIIGGSSDFALGTGDFTIEWWQKQVSDRLADRVFSVGNFPSASVAVSIEGTGSIYFWVNGNPSLNASISGFIDTWTHFAIVNSAGTCTGYQNGTSIFSGPLPSSIDDASTTFSIGNEYGGSSQSMTHFGGNLTNFRWSKGLARYTSDFTVPSSPLTADGSTDFLYLATDAGHLFFDEADNHSVSDAAGSAVTWSSDSPF